MGEVFSRDQPHQLQPVQCQLVCCNNWVVTAVSNMEVSQMLLHYVTWLSTNQILSHDLHPIRFCHMTFIQSDFVTCLHPIRFCHMTFIQSDFVTWLSANQILSHDFQPIKLCHMTFIQSLSVFLPLHHSNYAGTDNLSSHHQLNRLSSHCQLHRLLNHRQLSNLPQPRRQKIKKLSDCVHTWCTQWHALKGYTRVYMYIVS